jgi:hypothetical protein
MTRTTSCCLWEYLEERNDGRLGSIPNNSLVSNKESMRKPKNLLHREPWRFRLQLHFAIPVKATTHAVILLGVVARATTQPRRQLAHSNKLSPPTKTVLPTAAQRRGGTCSRLSFVTPALRTIGRQHSLMPQVSRFWRPGIQQISALGFVQPANIAAMDELRYSPSAPNTDALYCEEWSCFYAERRRLLARLFWFAAGLAISAFLFVATQGDHHPPLLVRTAIASSLGLFLIASFAQWFLFVWQMATWPCPRCAKRFFFSILAFDPFFTMRCRHCGLLRLKNAEARNPKHDVPEP